MPHGTNKAEIATGADPRVGISDLLAAPESWEAWQHRTKYIDETLTAYDSPEAQAISGHGWPVELSAAWRG